MVVEHTASIRMAMLIHITQSAAERFGCATLRAGVNKAVSSILLI